MIHILKSGTLTVATYDGFAPFAWSDGDVVRGYDIDFLRSFASKIGLQLRTQLYPFDGLWERPGRDEVDIAAAGLSKLSCRRTAGMQWSHPYFAVQRALVIRFEDRLRFQTIRDLADHVIEVTPGSAAHLDVETRKPHTTRLTFCHNLDDALRHLLDGRVDAFGTGDFGAYDYMKRFPGKLAVMDIHQYDEPEEFAFAVREKSGLVLALNSYIAMHRSDYWPKEG